MRKRLIKQMYDKMSDEDKRTLVQLSMQNKDREDILEALSRQKEQLDNIERKQDWKTDFLSDIAANFTTDAIIYIGSRLLKKM